jgi:serine/threonine protein kinase
VAELRLENSIVDDRYRIDRTLSRGSYAEIFLAFELSDDSPVIIKALNTSLQGTPDRDLERTLVENFQNEAVALDNVLNPNIIRRLGHGTAADLAGKAFHYLVLEYMPGGDMMSLCRKRPLTLAESIFYFGQVASALETAHSRLVIHRDIKPTNLLLSADHQVVKIADFGVAKIKPNDTDEITRVGTDIYAPPEHHPDSEGVTERLTPSADIYSLAKTIYTAMTGRAPREFSRRTITGLPEALARESWGGRLLEVLSKATADRSPDRYQTIGEFWAAFLQIGEPAASPETDPEATVVRPRTTGDSSGTDTAAITHAALMPSFEAAAISVHEAGGVRLQKARIVIDLPQRNENPPVPPGVAASRLDRGAVPAQAATASEATTQLLVESKAALDSRPRGEPAPQNQDGAEKNSTRNRGSSRQLIALRLRQVGWQDWMRRSFVVLLAAAFIGLVVSTYQIFAEFDGMRTIGRLLGVSGPANEGRIAGAANVNLRGEPGGAALVWLPAGTRVRVDETRGNWVRVRVIDWAGSRPDGATDVGWVDRRFVQMDQ